MNKKTPPIWVDRLLDAVLKERFADETIGDLHEWYELRQETQSKLQLTYYYYLSVVKALRFYKLKKIKELLILVTEIMMVNNNIKLSIRSLINNRFFTVINLIGLSVSLASFLFIYAYLSYELSYDDFHTNKDKIYRVLNASEETPIRGRPTPTPLAPTFNSYFPNEVTFARFGQDPVFLQIGDNKFYEEEFYWGDPTIFSVFDLPFLYGSATTALTEPNTIVLTQEKSEAYFGKGVDPVGKILPVKVYDSNAKLLMKVVGVMKKIPTNTELPFELIGSMSNALELYAQFNNHWGFLWLHTYAYVPNDSDLKRIVNHIPVMRKEVMASQVSNHHTFEFQPLDEVHLYSNDVLGAHTSGNINYVITFTIIGIFIILIATINYLNLMGARINKRRGEVGVRKVLGANKSQLFSQFLTESNITIVISLLIALVVVGMLFNQFTTFIGKPIPLDIFFNWYTVGLIALLVLICGAVSGIYPAMILTTLKLEVSVNNHKRVKRRNSFQKALVTFQFAISVFLIISTFIIFQQVQYMTQTNLGFNKEQLVSIKVEDRLLQDKIKLIRDEMANVTGVEAITISGESLPSEMNNTWDIWWEGLPKGESRPIHMVSVDPEFFDVLEIPIRQGTGFGEQHASDSANFIVLNQTAADLLNSPDPILQKVEIGGSKRTIIGVAEDHYYQSMQSEISPVAFLIIPSGDRISPDNIIVRLNTDQIFESISGLENTWKKFSETDYFSFHFVDETFQNIYDSENQFLNLFVIFAIISIVISCLGLYGVVLFTTEEKSKEISIRKVLGSSTSQIMMLISKKFLVLIFIGFIVGAPLAIYFSNDWLQQFPYRIDIGVLIILTSAGLVFLISALTIGLNTFKAAVSNPVDYLRNE